MQQNSNDTSTSSVEIPSAKELAKELAKLAIGMRHQEEASEKRKQDQKSLPVGGEAASKNYTTKNTREEVGIKSAKEEVKSRLENVLKKLANNSSTTYDNNIRTIKGKGRIPSQSAFLKELKNELNKLDKQKQKAATKSTKQWENFSGTFEQKNANGNKISSNATSKEADKSLKSMQNEREIGDPQSALKVVEEFQQKAQKEGKNQKNTESSMTVKNGALNILSTFAVVALLPLILLRGAINSITNLMKQHQKTTKASNKQR